MSRKRRPRNEAEAREWLKQFASEARDIQKEVLEAFRPVTENSRHAVPQWIEPFPLNPDLWFADAVDAYTLERPTRRKPRAPSMDVALGLKLGAGRPRGRQSGRPREAIHIHYLLALGYSWDAIRDFVRLPIKHKVTHEVRRRKVEVRILQRIYATHQDGIREHLLGLFGYYFVPFGYDLKDGKLIFNPTEAATVRMIFERFAETGSVTALKAEGITGKRRGATAIALAQTRSAHALVRALEAEGITGRRGKPIDEGYLYRLLNNPIYVGEVVSKGLYPGKHEAIVHRALWAKVQQHLSGAAPGLASNTS